MSVPIAAKGIRVVGFDQSEAMLALAKERAVKEGVGLQTEYVLASLPLPTALTKTYENAAGMVLCSSVMEYVDDYETVLRQFHAVLKPGGILLLSVPNRRCIFRILERMLRRLPGLQKSYLPHQRHHFDPNQLEALLDGFGYKAVEKEYFALPAQRFSERIFPGFRSQWTAWMVLITAQKR